tara:strand:- start:1485 stop:2105 length:621 start_codon:yes stop_codon:yes gene_type:complete
MKKILFLSCLFSFIILKSQNLDNSNTLIKNSPFHFFDGTFHLSYERAVSTNKSLNISGGFHFRGDNYYNNMQEDIGWNCEIQLRRYLISFDSDVLLNGIYFSPYFKGGYFKYKELSYWYINYDSNGDYYDVFYPESLFEIKNYQGGLIMGVQMLFKEIIVFDLFLGGGIQYAELNRDNFYHSNNGIWGRNYSGVVPRIGLNIGVVF